MEQKTRSTRWDKVELFTRPLRYIFLTAAVVVFLVTNLGAFRSETWQWIFVAFGILWLLSVAYIDIREFMCFSHRLLE